MADRELTTKEISLNYCAQLKEHIKAMTVIKEETAKYFAEDPRRQEGLKTLIEYDSTVKEAYEELEQLMEKFIG